MNIEWQTAANQFHKSAPHSDCYKSTLLLMLPHTQQQPTMSLALCRSVMARKKSVNLIQLICLRFGIIIIASHTYLWGESCHPWSIQRSTHIMWLSENPIVCVALSLSISVMSGAGAGLGTAESAAVNYGLFISKYKLCCCECLAPFGGNRFVRLQQQRISLRERERQTVRPKQNSRDLDADEDGMVVHGKDTTTVTPKGHPVVVCGFFPVSRSVWPQMLKRGRGRRLRGRVRLLSAIRLYYYDDGMPRGGG